MPVGPTLSLPENSELDDALEVAGTFLGSWDVEAEARKAGEAAKAQKADSGSSGEGRKRKRVAADYF